MSPEIVSDEETLRDETQVIETSFVSTDFTMFAHSYKITSSFIVFEKLFIVLRGKSVL